MVVDAALAHQPRFGTDSDDLPASARLWLKAVPAGQFAVLPLAAKGETTLALVLLGADGDPLPFPLRSSLVAATAVLAAACRESGLTRTVDGDGHSPALSDEPAPASVGSGSPAPASQMPAAPAAGAPRLDRRASVADLARTDTLVSPDTLTDTVASLMEREPNRDAVVLGRHGVPSGMVTRQRLLSQLSQIYGNALYRRKPIQELADLQPLIVNGTLPPNEAALRATKRPASTRYDPLVVTVGGSYHGLVAVSTLLDHLNGEAVRRARLSNALSGLPGAVLLEAEVTERVAAERPLSFVLADLDNFKPYNDYYGLARGDQVLLALARLGQKVMAETGREGDVFGHIGGDDFVIVTTPERAPQFCENLMSEFDTLAPQFYDLPDNKRKGIVAEGRDGQRRFFPLLALSVIAVSSDEVSPATYEMLTVEASRRKVAAKQAKRSNGFGAGHGFGEAASSA